MAACHVVPRLGSEINRAFSIATAHQYKVVKPGSAKWFMLPLLPKRLYVTDGQAHEYGPRACNSITEGTDHGSVAVQSKEDSSIPNGLQFDSYPVAKFTTKLIHQAAGAVWLVGKWVVVPALILMGVRDAILAVATGNELWIPIGLLVGTLFSGILKETLAELGMEFQSDVLPWHLVGLAFSFVIMRIGASKALPFGFRMFLYHFIVGGFWQTIRFCVDWKREKEQSLHEESRPL